MYTLPVRITWDPPLEPNGIILQYEYKLEQSNGVEVIIPLANTTETSVEQNVTVSPFTNYTLMVQAFTSGGGGPIVSITGLSPEAGRSDS